MSLGSSTTADGGQTAETQRGIWRVIRAAGALTKCPSAYFVKRHWCSLDGASSCRQWCSWDEVAAKPMKSQRAANALARNQRICISLPGLFEITTLLVQQFLSHWQAKSLLAPALCPASEIGVLPNIVKCSLNSAAIERGDCSRLLRSNRVKRRLLVSLVKSATMSKFLPFFELRLDPKWPVRGPCQSGIGYG